MVPLNLFRSGTPGTFTYTGCPCDGHRHQVQTGHWRADDHAEPDRQRALLRMRSRDGDV